LSSALLETEGLREEILMRNALIYLRHILILLQEQEKD